MLRSSKRGQIGLMELLMVIVIIGIIIAIGIYFFYQGFIGSVKKTGEELSMQEREVLLGMLGRIPEVRCSIGSRDENCLDALKIINARETIEDNKAYYINLLGFRSVKVELIYPERNSKECNANTYPDCGIFKLYENIKTGSENMHQDASILVSLYYPEQGKYKVGKLVLREYK